jgi:drug/metabolite transporter (DMT)-like permease
MYVITGYIGIEYSSPTLASAISNITPALTFILAIIFRMEKVSFKERSSVAKVMGTILSLIGALVVVLYHGPRVFVASSPPYINFRQLSPPLSSSNSDWLIGGALLTIRDIFVSVSFILQVQIFVLIHNRNNTKCWICSMQKRLILLSEAEFLKYNRLNRGKLVQP